MPLATTHVGNRDRSAPISGRRASPVPQIRRHRLDSRALARLLQDTRSECHPLLAAPLADAGRFKGAVTPQSWRGSLRRQFLERGFGRRDSVLSRRPFIPRTERLGDRQDR